ncbi:tetratricopeptide repeat protein [Lutibacter sp.]
MKNLLYILTFIITVTAISQTTNSLNLEKQKLKQALAYGDTNVAASSMLSIITLEGNKSTYKDSLAYLYFNKRNYSSCFLVLNDILKNKPNTIELLEMQAISLESLGAYGKAVEVYENLLAKTNNNYHAYKLAGLQLALKKFEDAYVSIKKANQLPDDGTIKITFQVNKNYNQNIDLKASIAYLEGIIALNLEKNKDAKLSFERAVQLFPDFVLAKGKLESLMSDE